MSSHLTEEILKNSSKVRFHTPSHAGKAGENVITDVTELSYTDNLLSPVSHISELEKYVASVFKAEACFISTQGATHNILQAVYSTASLGAFLIVGQAHSSVYNAMRITNAKAYHVDCFSEETVIPKDVKTVFFTSPDYFGHTLEMEKIYPFLHRNGYVVIVDSAHGGHFNFSSKLPVSASEYSDLCILSLHKTLPVLTGGSILLTKKEYAIKCSLCRKIFHTTSPNFSVICSIERAVKDFEKNGEKYYDEVVLSVEEFGKKILPPYSVEKTDDITRLVLSSPYDGKALYDILFIKGFVAEMSYENKVVFIVNPFNHASLRDLAKAVNETKDLPLFVKKDFPKRSHPYPTPMEFGGEPELVPLSSAKGRKVYNEVGFYPPGTPLLYSHDVITEEHIALLSDKNTLNNVFGLEKDGVFVLK